MQQAPDRRVGCARRLEGPGQPRLRLEEVRERIAPPAPVRRRPAPAALQRSAARPAGRGLRLCRRPPGRCQGGCGLAVHDLEGGPPHPRGGDPRLARGRLRAQPLQVGHERDAMAVGVQGAGGEGEGDQGEKGPLREV